MSSDSIVARLAKNRKKNIDLLKEGFALYEAEADDEYEELNADDGEEIDVSPDDSADDAEEEADQLSSEETEEDIPDDISDEIEDDSTAPEQGDPDDFDDIPMPSGGSSPSSTNDTPDEESEDTSQETPKTTSDQKKSYDNPLDNPYAIHYTLGDDIYLAYSGESNDVREGVVDGYDPEGFYRVKWSDGSYTNGITDIALRELVRTVKATTESKCVCGSTRLITENNHTICDICGRRIRESSEDDEKIRAEMHPMSTANKPNIAEAIKRALKGSKSLDEDTESPEDSFATLKTELDNQFWTKLDELIEDIEKLGYTVEESNDEYLIVSSDSDEDNVYQIYLGGTARTLTLDFSRSRLL